MSFTRVNNDFGENANSGVSLDITAWNTSSGNLLVGGFSHEGTAQTLTTTDTALDTFSYGTEEAHSGVDQWTQCFYDVSIAGQASNIVNCSVGSAVGFRGAAAAEYSASAAISFDSEGSAEASAATSVTANVTTTGAAGVIFAKAKVYSGSRTLVGGGDATLIAQFGQYHAYLEKIASAAGTYAMTCVVSAGGATSLTIAAVAFKESGGGASLVATSAQFDSRMKIARWW